MFRSYNDTIRTPIENETPTTSNDCAITYYCDLCTDGNWLSEADLEIHRKRAHATEVFRIMKQNQNRFCMVCMRVQDSPKSLIEHIKTDHLLSSPTARQVERQIFVCDCCNIIFFNKELLRTHLQLKHRSHTHCMKTYVECPKCEKSINIKALWYHLLLHDINNPSLCQICLNNYPNWHKMKVHLQSHPTHYLCPICGYESSKDKTFKAHSNSHYKRQYSLNIDKKVINRYYIARTNAFAFKYNIPNNIKGLKLPSNMYICILCREICTNNEEKERHILRDHTTFEKEKKKKHMCECGEEFFNAVLLKHHIFKLKGNHRIIKDGWNIPPAWDSIMNLIKSAPKHTTVRPQNTVSAFCINRNSDNNEESEADSEIPVMQTDSSPQVDYKEVIDHHGMTDNTIEMSEIEVTAVKQDVQG